MGVVVRQSVKSVLITFLGALLGVLATVLSMRYFPKIEYGFTQNLQKITMQLSFLGLFGFNYGLLYLSQRYPPGHAKRNAFMTLCLLFPMAFSVLIIGALFLFKNSFVSLYHPEDQAMMVRLYGTFPILSFLMVLISWLSFYLKAIQRNALEAFANEVLLRFGYIVLIVCYVFELLDFKQFIYAFALSYALPTAYLYFAAKKVGDLKLDFKIDFTKSEIMEFFRFSGYHMLTAVSSVLIFQIDALLLAPLGKDGLEALAVYAIATLAISLLKNPTRVVANAVIPTFTRHYLDADLKGLKRLFQHSCVNMQIFSFMAFAFILLNITFIQDVVTMVKSEGYEAVVWLLIILMIGQVVDMATGFNKEIIGLSKYYRFNFWISIGLLVVIFVLNFILIRKYGMYGAAWSTTIGLTLYGIVKSWFVWSKLKMQPFSKKSFLVLFFILLCGGIAFLIPATGFYYVDLILKNLVFAGLMLALLLKSRVSPEIISIVDSVLRRKK